PLRCARGRDPPVERAALVRRQRDSPARGWPDRHQGTDLQRQVRFQRPVRSDHDHRQCAEPSLGRHQEISAREQPDLDRGNLPRGQSARPHRQRELHGRRGRSADAGQEESGAARPQALQAIAAMTAMAHRRSISVIVLAAVLSATPVTAPASADTKYPDLKGQWRIIGGPMRFDTSKPWGPGQQAPLTPEYQAIFEANLKAQAEGGQGTTPTYTCLSPGMPRVTNGYGQLEIVVTPDTTHFLVQHIHDNR